MRSVLRVANNAMGWLILTCCVFLGSCGVFRPARDNAFRVRGEIKTVSKPQECTLELYLADSNQMISRAPIKPNFRQTVFIAPGVHKYYFMISCHGIPATYRSQTYELATAQQYVHPIDLGVISLEVKEKQL